MKKLVNFLFILLCISTYSYAQKGFTCSGFLPYHNNNQKWNTLLDKACDEINQKNFLSGYNILNDAMKEDCVSSNGKYTVDEKIKEYQGALRKYIIEHISDDVGTLTATETAFIKQYRASSEEKAKLVIDFLSHYVRNGDQKRFKTYTVGILGIDYYFDKALGDLIKSKKVNHKNIEIIKYTSISDVGSPQILYITNSEKFDFRGYTNNTNTIRITDDNYKKQALINFIKVNNKQTFELNVDNFQRKNIDLDKTLSQNGLLFNINGRGQHKYISFEDFQSNIIVNNQKTECVETKPIPKPIKEIVSKPQDLEHINKLRSERILQRDKDKLRLDGVSNISKSFFKLNEIIAEVNTVPTEGAPISLENVTIELKKESNSKTVFETGLTNNEGLYLFNNLNYDTHYYIYFSKEGYYPRAIRLQTYNGLDYTGIDTSINSFKEVYFNGIKNIEISLIKKEFEDIKNPYEDDNFSSIYLYKPIELSVFGYVWNGNEYINKITYAKKDSLFIYSGGIQKWDVKYYNEFEKGIEKAYKLELRIRNERKMIDFEMYAKLQLFEKDKIFQEKLLLSQTNKLNEAELKREKAVLVSKQNQIEMAKQEKKMKSIEDEQKETAHKAELKQRAMVLYSVLAGLLVVLIFSGFVVRSLRVRNKQNRIIVEQKKEVEKQRDVVEQQKSTVEKQKRIVEEKNREITQSIEYALRIQTAILPPQRIVKQYLENSFILYKPKDIVAGDFYWMEQISSKLESSKSEVLSAEAQLSTLNFELPTILFAACDCTGHGVPGAMVSVVCHNALNRAVREFGLTQPAAILDKTAEIVIENFSKSEENIKDGMDISLASITYDSQSKKIELQWAGANNPLWIVRGKGTSNDASGDVLLETKADKQPIGMNEDKKPFTNHSFALQSGDSIYLFTDGFADQFGGDTGEKKLTRKRFKEVLLSIQHLSMNQQGIELDKFITEYRKEVEQIDDILVMGVRV